MPAITGFLSHLPISAEALAEIQACFFRKQAARGDFFLKQGNVCRELAWLESGAMQFFTLRDGEEVTTYVATPGTFVSSVSSFIQQSPAVEYIRVIADCEYQVLSRTDFDRLRRELPAFQQVYVHLLEYQIGCMETSRREMLTQSPSDRYARLLAEEPHLLQSIPLQYLASLLGVTPRHLSRIRAQVR